MSITELYTILEGDSKGYFEDGMGHFHKNELQYQIHRGLVRVDGDVHLLIKEYKLLKEHFPKFDIELAYALHGRNSCACVIVKAIDYNKMLVIPKESGE